MVDWCTRFITSPQAQAQVLSTNTVTCVGAAFSLGAHSSVFNSVSDVTDLDSSMVVSVLVVSQNVSIPVTNLPARYSDFLDVFKKRNDDRLPRHIAPMIAQSNSKRAHTHRLGLSMGYLNLNLRPFACI